MEVLKQFTRFLACCHGYCVYKVWRIFVLFVQFIGFVEMLG